MKDTIRYFGAYRVQDGPRKGNLVSERNTPLLPLDIPEKLRAALNQPAKGRFPVLERALDLEGTTIPDSWNVENFLAVSCVAAANAERMDLGFPELSPAEVQLIVDSNSRTSGSAFKEGKNIINGDYCDLGYNVIFPDGTLFDGYIIMPGHYQEKRWGIPRYCSFGDNNSVKKRGDRGYVDEDDLVGTDSLFTTKIGQNYLNFIAKTIKQSA